MLTPGEYSLVDAGHCQCFAHELRVESIQVVLVYLLQQRLDESITSYYHDYSVFQTPLSLACSQFKHLSKSKRP